MKQLVCICGVWAAWILLTGFGPDSFETKLEKGNKLYSQSKYTEALNAYSDAQLEAPTRPEIAYNMGNALYRQKKPKEALEAYMKSIEKGDAELEGKAYYNAGNALFAQGRLGEALEAYRLSLERNPGDTDAQYNLEYTQKLMKEMMNQAAQTAQKARQERAQADKEQEASQSAGESADASPSRQSQTASGRDSISQEAFKEEAAHEKVQEPSEQKSREGGMASDSNNKQDSKQVAQLQDQKEGQGGELTREEAERFLSQYEASDKRQVLEAPGRRVASGSRRPVKDW